MDEVSLRVGDSERWGVDARLQQAVGDGLLTLAEYDERAGLVWQARTRQELEAVTRDLPAPAAAPVPAGREERGGRRPRARRVLAVMSGDELTGPVAEGQAVEAYALMGGAAVDLRRDDLPAHVQVRAVAVMGGVEVVVPRGVSVQLTGLSLMGGRTLNDLDPPRPGAPVVHVSGWALMGGVVVGHGPSDRAVAAGRPGQALPGAAGTGEPGPAHPGPTHLGPGHADPEHLASATGGARGSASSGSRALAPGLRHRRGRLRGGVVGLVAAAAVGAAVLGGNDAVAVFGSTVHRVQPGDSEVSVASAFGSVTVVVPDRARVTSHGAVVFGGSDCEACGEQSTGGPQVDVGAYGAFGSVAVLTQSQYERQRDEASGDGRQDEDADEDEQGRDGDGDGD